MEKIPKRKCAESLNTIQDEILSLTKNLDITFYMHDNILDDIIILDLLGEDAAPFSKVLAKKFGIAPIKFGEIKENRLLKGIITDSGRVGFGLFIDIGLRSPKRVDALLPLNKLRAQLADGKKEPIRKIIRDFCLRDYVPLQVRVTKIDYEENKIWVELSDDQIESIRNSLYDPLEKIIFTETSKKELETILEETDLKSDVASISSLSLFVYEVRFKIGSLKTSTIGKLYEYCRKYQIEICSPKKRHTLFS